MKFVGVMAVCCKRRRHEASGGLRHLHARTILALKKGGQNRPLVGGG